MVSDGSGVESDGSWLLGLLADAAVALQLEAMKDQV